MVVGMSTLAGGLGAGTATTLGAGATEGVAKTGAFTGAVAARVGGAMGAAVGWGVGSGAKAKGVGARLGRTGVAGGGGGGLIGGDGGGGGISLTTAMGITHSVARWSNPVCNAHKASTCNSTTPPIKMAVRCEEFQVGWCTTRITSSVDSQKKSLQMIACNHQNLTLAVSRQVRGSAGWT